MVKVFEECSYYEMLKVPVSAGPEDIKSAYRDALAVYDGDALATYSLFTDEQRADLLTQIDEAFATLSVQSKRAAYDRVLIHSGKAALKDFSPAGQTQLAGVSRCRLELEGSDKDICTLVKKKSKEPCNKTIKDSILTKSHISGKDLKTLRQAMGIDLSDIYGATKISATVINAIENNHYQTLPAKFYLTRFLHAYAELLQINPAHVADAYLKGMNGHANP